MAKEKSVDEITSDALREGGYLVNLYFDLHGDSEEGVKNIMVGFIGKLTKEPGVIYAVGEIDQPIEKEGIFSTWAEVKLLASDFPTLVRIAAQYSPIGVEILRPDEIKLPLSEAHNLLGNMSATTAEYKRYILTKVANPEELTQMKENMKRRADMGKEILNKKDRKG